MKLKSVKIFDTKISYYTYGRGRPFLFIHGHRADAQRCRGAILFFGQKFKVYAPDLPGFGRSPALKKPHTMDNYGYYLNKFVEKLNLKNYLLFGVSMGGVIVLKMMLQKPKILPAKLILVGTPYDKKYWKIPFSHKMILALGNKARFFLPLFEAIVKNDFLLYHLLYLSFPQEARKKAVIEYEMKQWRVMPIKIWFETMLEVAQVHFSKEKFQIKIPTFIINAQTDQYFNLQKSIKGLKRLCPNNDVLFLPFTTHIPKGELKLEHLKDFQSLLEKL